MRLLLTGLNGTLAPKLARAAVARGWEVTGWDRSRVDPEDTAAADAFLAATRPDAIAHLAFGAEGWAARLAAFAAGRGVPFLFTSTAMVFDHEPDGPHRPHDARTARDDYGRYKIRCEDAVRAASPSAVIARIGWQIDPDATGNNMLAQLDRWQRETGRVAASRLWRPATSFMADTAAALLDLIADPVPGPVHLDSNAVEGHGFDRVAMALKAAFGRDGWVVAAEDGYRHDQRLLGHADRLPPLSARLPL